MKRAASILGVVMAAIATVACAGPPRALDVASMSPDTRADYEVFALKCSKCHSLARPLNSGIDDDDYWKAYVAKMRRQPGSGISIEDSVAILRFLHVFSIEERRRKGKPVDVPPPAAAESPAPGGGGAGTVDASAAGPVDAAPLPASADGAAQNGRGGA